MTPPLSCPICRKPVSNPVGSAPNWFPFCSERCRQIDLLRWAQGKYAIVEPLTPERLLDETDSKEIPDD